MAKRYLLDKSALARASLPAVDRRLAPLMVSGQVVTCGVVELEVLFSARTFTELMELREVREAAFPNLRMEESDFARAIEVMQLLARKGHHRAAGIPDLLIAAVAERHRVTILHYDSDFELIASVTRQSTEWIVPRGTVP